MNAQGMGYGRRACEDLECCQQQRHEGKGIGLSADGEGVQKGGEEAQHRVPHEAAGGGGGGAGAQALQRGLDEQEGVVVVELPCVAVLALH